MKKDQIPVSGGDQRYADRSPSRRPRRPKAHTTPVTINSPHRATRSRHTVSRRRYATTQKHRTVEAAMAAAAAAMVTAASLSRRARPIASMATLNIVRGLRPTDSQPAPRCRRSSSPTSQQSSVAGKFLPQRPGSRPISIASVGDT